MKNNNGWLTLFVVAIALTTLSRTFIFRLVNGEFYLGFLFVFVLFLPKFLDWIWHLPLRPIDITISCDPLKPSASSICQNIREVFRRIYSDGGTYLVYICPMPNTGMRFAFNLVKQRVEARCGSELFPVEESNYQLPPFRIDNSPTIYRLSGDINEPNDGVFLKISASRGERILVSQLRVNKYAITIIEIMAVILGSILNISEIIICAIVLRRIKVSNLLEFWRYLVVIASLILGFWRIYSFAW